MHSFAFPSPSSHLDPVIEPYAQIHSIKNSPLENTERTVQVMQNQIGAEGTMGSKQCMCAAMDAMGLHHLVPQRLFQSPVSVVPWYLQLQPRANEDIVIHQQGPVDVHAHRD
jgi:hypothetical protein